jgi:hypothetical protein
MRHLLLTLTVRPFGHQDHAMSTDSRSPRPGASRLPDWWRAKPENLSLHTPGNSAEPAEPDWWDELYSSDDFAETSKDTDSEEPEAAASPTNTNWWTPQPGYYPQPHAPAFITDAPSRIALSPRTRSALYNAGAAGAGWVLGLYGPFAAALDDCGSNYSVSGALVVGVGGCLIIAHVWDRRTRHWWPGLAWAARIPLATAVLALALWAPAA